MKNLFTEASRAFSDFTDGIEQGLGSINSIAKVDELEGWEIPELMMQITYDLHHEYQNRGGDIEDFH